MQRGLYVSTRKVKKDLNLIRNDIEKTEKRHTFYPGVSYEEGVKKTITWLFDDGEYPLRRHL